MREREGNSAEIPARDRIPAPTYAQRLRSSAELVAMGVGVTIIGLGSSVLGAAGGTLVAGELFHHGIEVGAITGAFCGPMLAGLAAIHEILENDD